MERDTEREESHSAMVGIVIIVILMIIGAIGVFMQKSDTPIETSTQTTEVSEESADVISEL